MYYDDVTQVEKNAEIVIDNFLDNLLELHNNHDYTEIRKIFKIKEIKNINIDNDNFKNVAIKSNVYVKKTIGVVRQIIAGTIFTLWIQDILDDWNDTLNNLTIDDKLLLCKKCDFKNYYELNNTINFKINENVWDMFTVKCKRMNLTNSDGFQFALVYFIRESI